MLRVYLTFFTLMLYSLCIGQLVVTPLYLDQPSTFNPAAVGKFVDEAIHMSIFSFYEKNNNTRFGSPIFSAVSLVGNENKLSSSLEASEIYFLSYQKTISISDDLRFSFGVHGQVREDFTPKINTPQTVGANFAVHKTLRPIESKSRYISFGLQSSYVKETANILGGEEFFSELFLGQAEDFDEFIQNFSKSRLNLVLSADWTAIKRERILNTFAIMQKITYRNEFLLNSNVSLTSFILRSRFDFFITYALFHNRQKILKNDKAIFEYSVLIGAEFAINFGYGWKLENGNIWRLNASLNGSPGFVDIGAKLSYQTKKYNVSLFIGGRDPANGDVVVQFGVGYDLQATAKPSLFRLN